MMMQLNIYAKPLPQQLSVSISENTCCIIKENIIYTTPNLLMIEWLNHNNIIFKNTIYLKHMIDPFYKIKQNYLMVGIINIQKFSNNIQDKLKPYLENMFTPYFTNTLDSDTYVEFFTIINSTYVSKLFSQSNDESYINKLSIHDAYENNINLDFTNNCIN
jgi:hypothetical protein